MFDIENPKVYADTSGKAERRVFSYYAGYSHSFALNLLSSLALDPDAILLDPWNGAGTSTSAATLLGIRSIGQDINPVMVLAAKSALVTSNDIASLPLFAENIVSSIKNSTFIPLADEPLESWFVPESATFVRNIENAINRQGFRTDEYTNILSQSGVDQVDRLTSTLYICLFKCIKKMLSEFGTSNPTWIKVPKLDKRIELPKEFIYSAFISEVRNTCLILVDPILNPNNVEPIIRLGNSENLNISDESVDVILASPPYCTRIDYAVSTRLELAILRASINEFDVLRRIMMGTSTVPRIKMNPERIWGKTCSVFLTQLHDHSSVASRTYYYKSHVQYFNSLYKSLAELHRVLKKESRCFLVVQDSFYKDLLNPVCQIVIEMCESFGLELEHETAFIAAKSMASLNPKAKKYRADRRTAEKVLCFKK